jgi:hypothetical protein
MTGRWPSLSRPLRGCRLPGPRTRLASPRPTALRRQCAPPGLRSPAERWPIARVESQTGACATFLSWDPSAWIRHVPGHAPFTSSSITASVHSRATCPSRFGQRGATLADPVPSSWFRTTSTVSSACGSRACCSSVPDLGSTGFRRTAAFASRETRRMRAGSSPVRSYPSKASPRRQPCRIAAAVALLPFVAPPSRAVAEAAAATKALRSVPIARDLASGRDRSEERRDRGRPTPRAEPGICSRSAAGPHPRVRRAGAIRARVAPRAHVRSALDRSEPPVARRPEPHAGGASAPTALPPGSATDRVFTPLDLRLRPRSPRPERRDDEFEAWRPTSGPCSTDESVAPPAVAGDRCSFLPWALFPFEASGLSLAGAPGLPGSDPTADPRGAEPSVARRSDTPFGRVCPRKVPATVAGRWPP